MHSTRLCLGFALLGLFITVGCNKPNKDLGAPQSKDYTRQLPPGEMALVKLTDPADWPDFSEGYRRRAGLEEAALYSLDYLSRSSSQKFFPYLDITHDRAVASVHAFLDVLRSSQSGEELDATIKARFDIYKSRGCDDQGTVLYTGYYRPIFDARMRPDSEFRFPLYKRPADLAQDSNGHYQRYITRSEIEHGALAGKGLELCYLRDRFEAYIVTVQGSGRLRMADGTYFDIGYHGDNGHEYKSIGQTMVERGEITPAELSLQGLIRYFQENPGKLDAALSVNNRYVFFTPRGGGPYGSLNVPVTPFRSIATDKLVYPRACVSFMQTQLPARDSTGEISNHSYSGFALDQDTGGAIRAAGRCDVFMGTGPEVGELAGRTFSEGELYYIFVKSERDMSAEVASPLPEDLPEAEPTQ